MNTNKIWLVLGLVAIGLMATSCSQDGPESPDSKPIPRNAINLTVNTRAAADALVDFYSKFTIDMAKFAKESVDSNSNFVVSPISAAMVLSMAANASDENVQKAYCRYIGVDDIESLNELSRTLIEKLPIADNTSSFNIGNSIWVNSTYDIKLNDEFYNIVTSKYLATIRNLYFGNTETIKELNEWCASITNNKITNYFKDVSPATYAILLNSIYFNGKWCDDIFDSSRTQAAIFHGLDGDSSPLTMESVLTEGLYASDGTFESFTLSFGNKAYNLEIILPVQNAASTSNVELTAERITNLRKSYKTASIKTFLPKFSVMSNSNLNEMLEAINLEVLTVPGYKMFTKSIEGAIQFNQTASLTIDESGAEAASVTSGSMDPIAPEPMKEIVMKVDRPFYFFIREYSTDACIVSGRICNL